LRNQPYGPNRRNHRQVPWLRLLQPRRPSRRNQASRGFAAGIEVLGAPEGGLVVARHRHFFNGLPRDDSPFATFAKSLSPTSGLRILP
jgi:hypothetical protein